VRGSVARPAVAAVRSAAASCACARSLRQSGELGRCEVVVLARRSSRWARSARSDSLCESELAERVERERVRLAPCSEKDWLELVEDEAGSSLRARRRRKRPHVVRLAAAASRSPDQPESDTEHHVDRQASVQAQAPPSQCAPGSSLPLPPPPPHLASSPHSSADLTHASQQSTRPSSSSSSASALQSAASPSSQTRSTCASPPPPPPSPLPAATSDGLHAAPTPSSFKLTRSRPRTQAQRCHQPRRRPPGAQARRQELRLVPALVRVAARRSPRRCVSVLLLCSSRVLLI